MISQRSLKEPAAAVADEPKALPISVLGNIWAVSKMIYPQAASAVKEKGISEPDQLVFIPQSKVQGLIDALLATATALRESLPKSNLNDDLEGGIQSGKPIVSSRIPSSRHNNGNSVYGTEGLQQILRTQAASSDVLTEENMNAIQKFCEGILNGRVSMKLGG